MAYIRPRSREAMWVPRSDADINVAEGKRRHAERQKLDRQIVSRCLRLEVGRRVEIVWKLVETNRKMRLEGVLVEVYRWVDPTVVVAIVRLLDGRRLQVDATRVIYARGRR